MHGITAKEIVPLNAELWRKGLAAIAAGTP
jgi:hypothetical protein